MPIVRELVRDLPRSLARDATEGRYGLTATVYSLLAALNASRTNPLTAATGTNPTQVATSAVNVPVYETTIAAGVTVKNFSAGSPVIPYAGYRGVAWSGVDSLGTPIATPTMLASGLTKYAGGPAGNPNLGVLCEPSGTNLFLQSGFAGAVAGTPGTAPTSWPFGASGGSISSVVAGDVGANIVTVSVAANRQYIAQNVNLSANTTYNVSVLCVSNAAGLTMNNIFLISATPVGSVTTYYVNDGAVTNTTYVPQANDILSARIVVAGTAGTSTTRVGAGCSSNATGAVSFTQPQAVTGTLRTTYIPTTTGTVTRNARYSTISGSQLDGKFRLQLCSNEDLSSAAGRTTRLLSDGTRMLTYENGTGTPGLLVFRDESQVQGNELTDAQNASVWAASGTNTIVDDGAEVKITYVDNSTGGAIVFSALGGLTTNLTVGKTYLISGTVRVNAGSTATIRPSADTSKAITVTQTVATPFSFTAVATSTTANQLTVLGMGAGEICWVGNASVKEVAQMTYDVDLAAGTIYDLGLDVSTTAWKMYSGGVQIATAAATAPVTWGSTVYIGSSTTGTNVFNGGISVIQAGTTGFDAGSIT